MCVKKNKALLIQKRAKYLRIFHKKNFSATIVTMKGGQHLSTIVGFASMKLFIKKFLYKFFQELRREFFHGSGRRV